jgi:flagellar biosynthesis/type III secretory pathway protein FliH
MNDFNDDFHDGYNTGYIAGYKEASEISKQRLASMQAQIETMLKHFASLEKLIPSVVIMEKP